MSRISAQFKVDAALLAALAGLAATGAGAHWAGHHPELHISEHWRMAHACFAAIFSALGAIHIRHHARWYANIFRNFSRRRLSTAMLSLLFLVEFLSGILLLFTGTAGTPHHVAIFHWICGLILVLLGVNHIAHRITILSKGLRLRH